MKVLLIGATGLLGHNVLRRLTDEGHHVVALVRRKDGILMEGPWEVREGSPLDYASLKAAATGCDAIINCAGATRMDMLHYEDFLPANRDLCRLLVRAMEELEIKTMVHTSTVNTIGYGTAQAPADEQSPMEEPFLGSYYADSKREGEKTVLDAAGRLADRHIVVLNPGYMLGPWDVKPSSGRMLLAAYKKALMAAPKGGKAFVHVADVAQAAVNALSKGRSGSRYIVTNSRGCMTLRELYRLQADVCGYRQRLLDLPNWLMRAAGRVGDLAHSLGLKTEVSTRNVKQLMVHEYYSNRLAVSELGLTETPIADAIRDFHEWRNKKMTL